MLCLIEDCSISLLLGIIRLSLIFFLYSLSKGFIIMKYSRYFIIFITIILLSACTQNGEQKEQKKNVTLTISAAASLQNVLIDIQKEFKKEYPSVSIVYNFGGSGTLQQQILKGAPIDLYIFADEKKQNS